MSVSAWATQLQAQLLQPLSRPLLCQSSGDHRPTREGAQAPVFKFPLPFTFARQERIPGRGVRQTWAQNFTLLLAATKLSEPQFSCLESLDLVWILRQV